MCWLNSASKLLEIVLYSRLTTEHCFDLGVFMTTRETELIEVM